MSKHFQYIVKKRLGAVCRVLFGAFILIGCCSVSSAQTLKYRVSWKGDSIGYIIAKKTENKNQQSYHIKTEANISVIFSFTMVTDFHAHFEEGILKEATTKSSLNDKERSYSKVNYIAGAYNIETDEGNSKLHGKIKESVVAMYFNEPAHEKVFSERYGKMCEVKRVSSDKYELKKPDGRNNYYYFENGICQSGEINHSLATFFFEKIN
ncbi:MAG: DUF6134 family protein [Bacteroidota bacterium]